MCGGGGGGVGNFLNKAQDFAPLRDTFGDNIDYAISPLLSGNQTVSGGFDATPGSYAEKKYQNLGVDQMVPTINMFAKAIASAGAASAYGAGSEGSVPADIEATGTSAPNAPGAGAPASASYGQSGTDQLLGQGDQPQMPPAQALNPDALQAMGLQQVPDATGGLTGSQMYTQTGTP